MDPEQLQRIAKYLTIPITAVLGTLVYALLYVFLK